MTENLDIFYFRTLLRLYHASAEMWNRDTIILPIDAVNVWKGRENALEARKVISEAVRTLFRGRKNAF
jgi:hypothetical protein